MRGVLLLNIGTPAECSKPAVEQFIGDMLSDPLVLDKFQLASKFLARQVIAPLSAAKSQKKYSLIWRKEEPTISPMLYYMQQQSEKLEKQKNIPVEIAMRYGSPSIEEILLMAKYTPSFDQEEWKYYGLDILGAEYNWRK